MAYERYKLETLKKMLDKADEKLSKETLKPCGNWGDGMRRAKLKSNIAYERAKAKVEELKAAIALKESGASVPSAPKQKFVIRIYKEKYGWENYDDTIYRVPEKDVRKNDILTEMYESSFNSLKRLWSMLLMHYEGYTYCVKDLSTDTVIVGGVYDPNDIEWLDEYSA